MEYNLCGILLTKNCNAKCRICCDFRGQLPLKWERLDDLIRGAIMFGVLSGLSCLTA